VKRPTPSLSTGEGTSDDDDTRPVSVTLRMTRDAVTVRAEVPRGPSRPIRYLPLFRAIADAVVERAEHAAEKAGRSISCKAGCGACCRQLVPISATEAHFLRDLVEDLPPPRRRIVERRFADARARLAEAGMLDRLLSPGPLTDPEFSALGLEYFALGIACPFLEEESCSIHPERPVICREFLVTSPAELCARPAAGQHERLFIEGDVSQALNRLQSEERPARGVHWIPLALAPDWANEHPHLDPPQDADALLARSLELVQEHAAQADPSLRKKKKSR
jgi:Fe-S-cluster containining protein